MFIFSLSLSLTCYFKRRRKEVGKLLEKMGRSKGGREKKWSSSGEGRQNDMRSTDGERGGRLREEGRR